MYLFRSFSAYFFFVLISSSVVKASPNNCRSLLCNEGQSQYFCHKDQISYNFNTVKITNPELIGLWKYNVSSHKITFWGPCPSCGGLISDYMWKKVKEKKRKHFCCLPWLLTSDSDDQEEYEEPDKKQAFWVNCECGHHHGGYSKSRRLMTNESDQDFVKILGCGSIVSITMDEIDRAKVLSKMKLEGNKNEGSSTEDSIEQ